MYRSYQKIDRRKSRVIHLGNVKIGGGAPITVQTMTNTITADVNSTLSQIERVINVGADIVRVSVPDQDSSVALKNIGVFDLNISRQLLKYEKLYKMITYYDNLFERNNNVILFSLLN